MLRNNPPPPICHLVLLETMPRGESGATAISQSRRKYIGRSAARCSANITSNTSARSNTTGTLRGSSAARLTVKLCGGISIVFGYSRTLSHPTQDRSSAATAIPASLTGSDPRKKPSGKMTVSASAPSTPRPASIRSCNGPRTPSCRAARSSTLPRVSASVLHRL